MNIVEEAQSIAVKEFKYYEMLYQINKENNLYYQRLKKHNKKLDFKKNINHDENLY